MVLYDSTARSSEVTSDYGSGHNCANADCNAELILSEDAVLLQVVLPQLNEGQLVPAPFLAPDGEYAYTPYFFHESCWDGYSDSLFQLLEDYDVRAVRDEHSFTLCCVCLSGIRLYEPTALVSCGVLEANRRCPDGRDTTSFHTQKTDYICLACIRALNDEILELWDSSITYAGECPACTHERIWRHGKTCCHPWPEEEDADDDDE